jgi:hypothetical protein
MRHQLSEVAMVFSVHDLPCNLDALFTKFLIHKSIWITIDWIGAADCGFLKWRPSHGGPINQSVMPTSQPEPRHVGNIPESSMFHLLVA